MRSALRTYTDGDVSGLDLRAERVRRRVSSGTIARRLGLSPRAIQARELEARPDPAFVRRYFRALVAADAEAVLRTNRERESAMSPEK